jgi:hypothetical protein
MRSRAQLFAVGVAVVASAAVHGWYATFLVRNSVSIHDALIASVQGLPKTLAVLLPAWLPALIPLRHPRLNKWVSLVCGSVSLALGVSFGVVFALTREAFAVPLTVVFGVVGVLLLGPLMRAPKLAGGVREV